MRRSWLLLVVVAIYLLHNDLWWWDDPRRVFGLPIGLAYHVGYCLVVSAVMAVAVRRAWPLAVGEAGGREREP